MLTPKDIITKGKVAPTNWGQPDIAIKETNKDIKNIKSAEY